MGNAVSTLKAREKMCKARAGEITLPKILQMGIGTGGVDSNGNVINPTGTETELNNQILVRNVTYEFINNTTCKYSCLIGKQELAGVDISEIGLLDSDGDLVAIKTFSQKHKDTDMEMIFSISDVF